MTCFAESPRCRCQLFGPYCWRMFLPPVVQRWWHGWAGGLRASTAARVGCISAPDFGRLHCIAVASIWRLLVVSVRYHQLWGDLCWATKIHHVDREISEQALQMLIALATFSRRQLFFTLFAGALFTQPGACMFPGPPFQGRASAARTKRTALVILVVIGVVCWCCRCGAGVARSFFASEGTAVDGVHRSCSSPPQVLYVRNRSRPQLWYSGVTVIFRFCLPWALRAIAQLLNRIWLHWLCSAGYAVTGDGFILGFTPAVGCEQFRC